MDVTNARADIRADMAELETRMVTKLLIWIVGLSMVQMLATVGTALIA